MTYAQIKSGGKLHLVCEPGEEYKGEIIRAGRLSLPLCGQRVPGRGYRMNINVPLGHACKRCLRSYARMRREADPA